jgi:indolepyruvate ferredoxin oxidoreductase
MQEDRDMDRTRASLEAKYTETEGSIFLSGIQALVRLPLVQRRLDAAAGLRTAGFISGYRGSPLGGLDQQLAKARSHLDEAGVRFAPGVNEDLAATAVWGSQQVGSFPGARVDGVFGLWYGKAPGVDRSGDVFKHANAAGTSARGGVLALAGDDHACKSSTLPSQSEFALLDACIPVLHPADVQEVLDLGLHGWALSRFSGLWVGMIALADTMDSAATVRAEIDRVVPRLPEIERPRGGLHLRPGRPPLELEELLHRYRLPAARAYARENALDRVLEPAPDATLGIVTTGSAHLELLEALAQLGIRERAAALGIRIYKVAMPWPLEPEGLRRFADGLESVLVVEEKRGLIEPQVKEHLYGLGARQPRVVGKRDEHGALLLRETGELRSNEIVRALARYLPARTPEIEARLREIETRRASVERLEVRTARTPFYCPGCPHNRSTAVPEGSRGLAGIGCHYMVTWMDRDTTTFSQMGGEGVQWIGQAPFTDEPHVFANLGDGTYFHSGILAIRAAVAAGVPITYKILYNDAVAMTGGQAVDGPFDVPTLIRQLQAEGVRTIRVVADDVTRHRGLDVPVEPRDALESVQRELRETPGVSVLIYDQTCAAELRRRRKRGQAEDPPHRLFIHPEVCEGCGDCSEQSFCAAVEPIDTELGRKRRIHQSSCNKDYSCANGLCPSFVRLDGAKLRRQRAALPALDEELPLPAPCPLGDAPWSLLVTGIGGNGVVTLGALVGMAAHLDGLATTTLDMTGLAQKGGAVTSQVRISRAADARHTPRLAPGATDVLLACDVVVAAGPAALRTLDPARTASVINTHLVPTADFVLDNRVRFDGDSLVKRVRDASREGFALDATALAERLCGDAIGANLMMLGYAFQKGLLPVSLEALLEAIELNGVSVELNRLAFALGRVAAHRPDALGTPRPPAPAPTLEARVDRLAELLRRYQDDAYARRYRALVERVRAEEQRALPESSRLTRAVAESYYQLLAYKDEYEVARLYSDPSFKAKLADEFEGEYKIELLLAPPLWARRDPATGRPKKRAYGPWVLRVFPLLSRMKFLRGTRLDPFGYTADRRLERALIGRYEATLERLLARLDEDNLPLAAEIAALPQEIRGFDSIKRERAAQAERKEAELLERYEKQ